MTSGGVCLFIQKPLIGDMRVERPLAASLSGVVNVKRTAGVLEIVSILMVPPHDELPEYDV